MHNKNKTKLGKIRSIKWEFLITKKGVKSTEFQQRLKRKQSDDQIDLHVAK